MGELALRKVKEVITYKKQVGKLVHMTRTSGFANWHLPKMASYSPTEAERQRPYFQVFFPGRYFRVSSS